MNAVYVSLTSLVTMGRLVIPTYIEASTVWEFEALAREWQSSTEPHRSIVAERLFAAIGLAVTLPHYRAMHVYQAIRVPKSAAIAHYLEKATQLFYAQDYFSCMLVLLPAVEKLILFHIGHLSHAVVTTSDMRSKITASVSTTDIMLQARYEMYKEYVLRFIERFQLRAALAAGSTGSNIFRNRIFHVAHDEPFYTYAECVTLFCFFDAYIQLLALEDNCEIYGLVPDNAEIRERARLYWTIIFDDYLTGDVHGEKQMTATGCYYFPESADRNYLTLLEPGRETKQMVLHALLMLGSDKVAEYGARVLGIQDSSRAAILATGISDHRTFHALGMKIQTPP